MVLDQLGGNICRALQRIGDTAVIDAKLLDDCLDEIGSALLQSDVQIQMISAMQSYIKDIAKTQARSHFKRRFIQKAVFYELCKIFYLRRLSFTPKTGRTNVILFVGLQGSGKTTTCAKYAYYHRKKGFKPALVCADTFRTDAFDQLKQKAAKAEIPFHGSYLKSDPAEIAYKGVEMFKLEGRDLIIVDTSGRHKQEDTLFEDMHHMLSAVRPDLVIFVMDGSIGQAAFYQAQAFKKIAPDGVAILTKMDGCAKGGGALSAVAAAKSSVIFIGTGEHIHDFEVFDVKPLVSRLLGLNNVNNEL